MHHCSKLTGLFFSTFYDKMVQIAKTSSTQRQKFKYLDVGALSDNVLKSLREEANPEKRKDVIRSRLQESFSEAQVLSKAPLTLSEELISMAIFLFGVPGAVFIIPLVLICSYVHFYLTGSYYILAMTVSMICILSALPGKFKEQYLASWPAVAMLRYLSFKVAFTQFLEKGKPYILVAPPHGVSLYYRLLFSKFFYHNEINRLCCF